MRERGEQREDGYVGGGERSWLGGGGETMRRTVRLSGRKSKEKRLGGDGGGVRSGDGDARGGRFCGI